MVTELFVKIFKKIVKFFIKIVYISISSRYNVKIIIVKKARITL